jgi:hypothetical protein
MTIMGPQTGHILSVTAQSGIEGTYCGGPQTEGWRVRQHGSRQDSGRRLRLQRYAVHFHREIAAGDALDLNQWTSVGVPEPLDIGGPCSLRIRHLSR